uniref:TGF-beta family profile domain-containing protein n=1 Tax=Neogobius melanostomus TaxID=47308 RepID=A0A8C6UK49_9GOBI
MSFACVLMMVLLGSSVVVAFVLQPLHGESDGSMTSAGFHQSCHGVSLQTIKRDLLKSLNLQTEPQVPVGLLHSVHEQWKMAFSALSNQAHGSEAKITVLFSVPVAHTASVSDGGNNNSVKCCSLTSEVFMKDLGWDNWVIHPLSLTVTHCKLCSGVGNAVQLCSLPTSANTTHVPCCHPTSQKMVPIVYMDEFGSVVISSVQLTQGCGCSFQRYHGPSGSQ